jgi:hypothetical protein
MGFPFDNCGARTPVRAGAAPGRVMSMACLVAALTACGDDEGSKDEACTPGTSEGCDGDQVCEHVTGGEPACFAPVLVRGRVLDLSDESGIEGATIVALDINGSARSGVVLSGENGEYEISLPAERDGDGAPVEDKVTLRVAASGFQSFPTPPREALPIDLTATENGEEDALVVMNAATDVGLVPLPVSSGELATVDGSIEHEFAAGALVVAVQGGRAVSTAIADLEGAFTLFNVPAGETQIEGYRSGLAVAPETITAEAGERLADVVLSASSEGLASVTGSVTIVNAEGGLETTVILVLESTFSESPGIARGVAPAGLRVADVSSQFEIKDVPPGKYAVLAAFENDELVRDPDEGISGTEVVHIEVTAGAGETALPTSFKITEALAVVAPGADGLELLATGEDPTFSWADDSSEDGYELRVFDAFGELVHEALNVARVSGSAAVTYTWVRGGAELEPGMIYQFRVMSWREGRSDGGGRSYISATEDLRGVFQAGSTEP